MKLSVIICCYNSVSRLEPTLKALIHQMTTIKWEVILVDNNSDDGTAEFAQKTWESNTNTIPFRVVNENSPGLSFARKKGVQEANGELILFCDDDNYLKSNYVENAFHIMKSDQQIGALCGKNNPLFTSTPSDFILKNLSAYACGELAESSTYLNSNIVPWGAGLVIRRDFISKVYAQNFTSLLSDRKGKELSSGGDTEFCYLIRMSGFTWKYDTQLELDHAIPQNRLNEAHLEKLYYGFGKANAVIDWYYGRGDLKRLENDVKWWKVYLATWWSFKSKKRSGSKMFQNGYLDQLKSDRDAFKQKRSSVRIILKKLNGA